MNVGAKETAACPSRSGRLIRVFRRPLGANISVWRSVVIFFSSAFENFQIPPNKPQKSISDSFYVGDADVRNAAIRKQREVRCYVSSFPIFFFVILARVKEKHWKKRGKQRKKKERDHHANTVRSRLQLVTRNRRKNTLGQQSKQTTVSKKKKRSKKKRKWRVTQNSRKKTAKTQRKTNATRLGEVLKLGLPSD